MGVVPLSPLSLDQLQGDKNDFVQLRIALVSPLRLRKSKAPHPCGCGAK